jgi:uracil-DNA glycosylase
MLEEECSQQYFKDIISFVSAERKKTTVFPPEDEVFNALNFTPLSSVKVVIFGQDPYFGDDQAHGLCFSVKRGVKPPPSLVRIYKVIEKTIPGFIIPEHGNLEAWASQGVLLLNATLTVEKGKPNSHANCGWQRFTDRIIEILNKEKKFLVFMLWGGFAQTKGSKVDRARHCVIHAPHPSPMSGSEWNDCTHFHDANFYLRSKNQTAIDWKL